MLRHLPLAALLFAGALAAPLFADYPSPAYLGAFEALDKGQYIEVRETAEQAIRRQPDSFEAWYLLGAVYAQGEANLPRAHYCLTHARDLIEKHWSLPIAPDGPWRIHSRIINELIEVASLSDRYQEEVDLIKVHDQFYTPSRARRAGWPLMKLGRTQEAEKRMMSLLHSQDEREVTSALNTLGSIESELGNYEKSYDWFSRLVSDSRARGRDMPAVYLFNLSEAATSLLRFPEAERELLEAADHFDSGDSTNPYENLAFYYASAARLPEAVSALRRMQTWNGNTDPMLAEQMWRESQQTVALVLLAAGLDDAGLGILRRALNQPDRRGTTSSSSALSEIDFLHLYREALKLRRERLREEMSWDTPLEWIQALGERLSLTRAIWSAGSQDAAVIMREGKLNWSTVPYAADTTTPEWLRATFHEVVGEGPWESELRRQLRQNSTLAVLKRPYYLAQLGESEWSRGEYRAALSDLKQAETTLPGEEALLRARLNALIGNACEQTGDMPAALSRYARAFEKDPHVFRALGLPLPAAIVSDADPLSARAASLLRGSPRFHGAKGFRVRVARLGARLTGTLEGPDGVIYCVVASPVRGDAASAARNFAREFHARAFSARLDLSQSDIGSLEGSNQSATADRHSLGEMLGH
jgi:tetratricopeptide (TPR) repeat protein